MGAGASSCCGCLPSNRYRRFPDDHDHGGSSTQLRSLHPASHHNMGTNTEDDDEFAGETDSLLDALSVKDATELVIQAAQEPSSEVLAQPSPLVRTESMENLFTCAICLDIVYDPVRAPCHHYFCLVCLRRYLDYEGEEATCPKCREVLHLRPDGLSVDTNTAKQLSVVFSDEMEGRADLQAQEELEYETARQDRERRERLMEENPLEALLETEHELQRDVFLIANLGFSVVAAQKAVFVGGGVQQDAIDWIIQHQHDVLLNIPWSMGELQEQLVMRNVRSTLNSEHSAPFTMTLVPGQLTVNVSTVRLVGTLGRTCWCFVTCGFRNLGHRELVMFLVAYGQPNEHTEIAKLLVRLFQLVRRGVVLQHAGFIEFRPDSPRLFGDHANTGLIFANYCGQCIPTLPILRNEALFAVMVRGPEITWAKYYPIRLLMKLGQMYNADYPFPLWSDARRYAVFRERDVLRTQHLQSALRLHDANVMRLMSETEKVYICFVLPVEQRQEIRRFLESWPDNTPIPFLTGFCRGADSHLVFDPSNPTKASAISLPHSRTVAIGASHVILVPDQRERGNGGAVRGDALVMNLLPGSYATVVESLRSGEACTIESTTTRRGVRYLGLKIQWAAAADIRGGLAHADVEDFPSRNQAMHLLLDTSLTGRPVGPCEQSGRLRLINWALRTPVAKALELASPEDITQFVGTLVHTLDQLLASRLLPPTCLATVAPSLFLLQVDIKNGEELKFRMSSNWTDTLPQAPSVSLALWSDTLHSLRPPMLRSPEESINLQVRMQVV